MVWVEKKNIDLIQAVKLFQKGVFLKPMEEETVASFVCRILSIDRETARRKIETIMVNNRVVDDPDTRVLCPGDRLVLSGAMPGLVGAMLRSGSPLHAMRTDITSRQRPGRENEAGSTHVEVTLFNTVLKQFAEALLTHGFFLLQDSKEER